MFKVIGRIVSYLTKNMSYILDIIESLVKLIQGVVFLTPIKKDDEIFRKRIKVFFDRLKKFLYNISDYFEGR